MQTDNTRAESPTREADDTLTQLANRLRIHNKWRRGDEELPQADPTQLGLDIDAAAEAIDRVAAQAAEIERRRAGYRARHDENATTIADLRAKLAEAEGVLSKLPVTKDGVRVVPGVDEVWVWEEDRSLDKPEQKLWEREISVGCDCCSTSEEDSMCNNPGEAYSTESAARAAAEKGGGE